MAIDNGPPGVLDFANDHFQTSPWATYEWHCRNAPVAWSARMNSYFVFGAEYVRTVLTSPQFTAHDPFRRTQLAFGPSVLDTDGQLHKRLRTILSRAINYRSPQSIRTQLLGPAVRQIVTPCIVHRDVWPQEVARLLPMRVVSGLLGVNEEDEGSIHQLTGTLIDFIDHGETTFSAVVECRKHLQSLLRTKLSSTSLFVELSEAVGESTAVNNLSMVIAAGTGTVSASITNLLAHIGSQPSLLERCRSEPNIIPLIVAHTLRQYPPLHFTIRYASSDAKLHGVDLLKGRSVQVGLASGIVHSTGADRPGRRKPADDEGPSFTFGVGKHHCLGARLAQLELECLLGHLAEEFRWLTVEGPTPAVPVGRTIRGISGLRIATSPHARRF